MLYPLDENIKRLRILSGWHQIDFGKKLGVTKQCVSNWECDNVQPSIEMLIKMAEVFSVSTDFLLGREMLCSIDASGLSEAEVLHITQLVADLKNKN